MIHRRTDHCFPAGGQTLMPFAELCRKHAFSEAVFVIDGVNLGLHGAFAGRHAGLSGSGSRTYCVLGLRPAVDPLFMMTPQPGNQTRFVGAGDLFDRIRVCNFLGTRPPCAVVLRAGAALNRWQPCSRALRSVVLASCWGALLSRPRASARHLYRDCDARP